LILTTDANGARAHAGAPLMNIDTNRTATAAANVTIDATTDATIADATTATNNDNDNDNDKGCNALGTTLAVLSGERWVAIANASEGDRPVRMVCLFERGRNLTLDIQRLPSSPLPLAPYMLGLPGGSERERSRFSTYADLMGSVELVKITCATNDPPAALADLLESALHPPAVLTEGGTP
jgi:hypothetical protein